MAAGQGFKNFSTGDVLTSSDVNGYLMQGVWVFASAAARTSAVTSPQEGNVSFLKDTNALEIYDGAAWVAYGAGDITDITAGTGISGGGTSGAVTITNSMATAIDAKGDLVVGTGADAFSRLAVGANNTVLTADSTTATGLKWATPSAGGFTLISTNTLGAATLTMDSIPTTYKHLLLVFRNAGNATNSTDYSYMRFNNDSGSNYHGIFESTASSTANAPGATTAVNPIQQIFSFLSAGVSTGYAGNGYMWIYDYANASAFKSWAYQVNGFQTGSGQMIHTGQGSYDSNTAITRIDIIRSGSQTNSGTVLLYGVS